MSAEIDEYREGRITMRAVVDAYGAEERAMGWYHYLEGEISFPFQALCLKRKVKSPLHKDGFYSVKRMADVDDCVRDMYVMVEFDDDELAVQLSQLEPIGELDDESREAICDWHYWCEHGYQF